MDPGAETVSAELQLQSESPAGQNLEGREDEEEEGHNGTDSKGTKQFVRMFQLIPELSLKLQDHVMVLDLQLLLIK